MRWLQRRPRPRPPPIPPTPARIPLLRAVKDTAAPTETADAARQAGADAYVHAAAKIAALDADDQSILYTPLFTYAENPDASRTISFGNYLAALYAEAVANDTASGLPEGASVEASQAV